MNNTEFESIDKFLREIGVGRRDLNDPFFDETHEKCKVFRRIGVTVEDNEEFCHRVMKEFQCNGPRCRAVFRNLIDYEIHYNGAHRYACQECKTTRPNARLLEIHVQETHDSFFKVLSEKQSVYQCYVSECDEKFPNPNERSAHCVAIHKFPKNFRYDSRGRRKDKREVKNAMEVEEKEKRDEKKIKIRLDKNQKTKTFVRSTARNKQNISDSLMECNDNILSSDEISIDDKNTEISVNNQEPAYKSLLAFVPRQVAQKSYTKALTKNATMEKNVLETDSLMDLAESLPD